MEAMANHATIDQIPKSQELQDMLNLEKLRPKFLVVFGQNQEHRFHYKCMCSSLIPTHTRLRLEPYIVNFIWKPLPKVMKISKQCLIFVNFGVKNFPVRNDPQKNFDL